MYRVLLVDDEKYVRLWIKNCINWQDSGFEIVGETSNGFDALDKIENLKPNLVITDMSMPGLDGVKLIERASKVFPNLLFVVLSGYNRFEYLRSAVKWNAVDYLLKPVKAEELVQVLISVKEKLEQLENRIEEGQKANTLTSENIELKKERLISNLLNEQIYDDQNLLKEAEELGIQIKNNFYCAVTIAIDESSSSDDQNSASKLNFCKSSVIDVSCKVINTHEMEAYFLAKKDEIAGIISLSQNNVAYQDILDVCKKIINVINDSFNVEVSIGIGSVVNSIDLIGASYSQAKKAIELRIIYGSKNVLTFINASQGNNKEVLKVINDSNFVNSILSYNINSCETIIKTIFSKIMEMNQVNMETIKMVYYRLISLIFNVMYEADIAPSYLGSSELEIFTSIKNFSSIDQIEEKLIYYSRKAIECILNTQNIKSTAVEKAKKYISDHLADDISLTDIADCIHVTPNYLCALFKAESGQTLFDFITNLRINQAMILMRDENIKTYEIGKMTGYSDPKYFSRVFKKVTGMPPSSYRRSLFKEQ